MGKYFSAAAEREQAEREFTIQSTSGIWNTDLYPETQVPDDALADSLNIYPGTLQDGMRPSRASRTGSGTQQIKGLHIYTQDGGTKYQMYAKNGVVRYISGNPDPTVEGSLTANNFEFITYKDNKVYYVNGDNSLRSWDGTTAGAVTAYSVSGSEPANLLADSSDKIHDCQLIEVHEGVMYLARNATYPWRVYRCDEVRGPTYWHNWVDVISPNNGKVVRIKSFNGVLIVLKEDSIWRIDGFIGDSSLSLKLLHGGIGCISGRTVQEVPGIGLVFMGSDKHIYALRPEYVRGENIPLFRLSAHISNTINAIYSAAAACAGVVKNRYWVSVQMVSTNSTNETALVFDATKVAAMPNDPTALFVPWGIFTPSYATCFVTDGSTMYYAEAAVDVLATTEVVIVDNAAASSYFITKAHDMNLPRRDKNVSEIWLVLRQVDETVTPSIGVDNGSLTALDTVNPAPSGGSTRWTMSYNASAGANKYDTYRVYVNKMGKRFQLKVAGATEVTQVGFSYTIESVRG